MPGAPVSLIVGLNVGYGGTFGDKAKGRFLFGLPIGEPVTENGLLVQYFERGRLELHPELGGTPYEIQLGHLGALALQAAHR